MSNKNIGIEKKSWYFFRLQEIVFEDENLDTYEKAIYAVISRYADLDDRICYPSMKTIAQKASCSINKTRKCINKLVKAGYITKKIRQKEKGNYNSNLYRVKDLAYISNAINYAKENNNKKMLKKINEKLQTHPLPTEKEITKIKYEYDDMENSKVKSQNKKEKELENLYKSGYR